MKNTLYQKAKDLLPKAYAPYSHFKVAASICTEDGNIYIGVNVENASYGLTLCAEASAMTAMVSAGEQKIKEILVMTEAGGLCPPCGACRQRLHEFSTPNTLVYLVEKDRIVKELKLEELLPFAFDLDKD